MKKDQYRQLASLFVLLAIVAAAAVAVAAEPSGGYLAYKEPEPAGASWLSTLAYLFTLFIMFGAVLAMAYGTSRFLGKKMGHTALQGDNKICVSIAMGQNKSVQVVEVAGCFLVLGVTDHNINLLQEITDAEQIEKLKVMQTTEAVAPFDMVFQKQIASLQQLSNKFPGVFGNYGRKDK